MSEKKSKIKEISIMVYRKFTEDFDSLGFRLGLSVEVKDGDARDSWYQGRLFLKERIEEEEKEIEKKFDLLKKQKEKGKVPQGVKGVGYEELQLENIPEEARIYLCKNVDDAISRVMFMTDMTKTNVNDAIRNIMLTGVSERDAVIELGGLKGVVLKFDDGKGSERGLIDVKEIIRTSDKAVFVGLFDGRKVWIPKSCIRGSGVVDSYEKGIKTMLYIDIWFLEKNNIVY